MHQVTYTAAAMADKRVLADMDPDYEDITDHQIKRQRVIEDNGTLLMTEWDIWTENHIYLRPVEYFTCITITVSVSLSHSLNVANWMLFLAY